LKYGALDSIDDVTHVHVSFNFNQIAMENNLLQPFPATFRHLILPFRSGYAMHAALDHRQTNGREIHMVILMLWLKVVPSDGIGIFNP
jgi:hypothetical protein